MALKSSLPQQGSENACLLHSKEDDGVVHHASRFHHGDKAGGQAKATVGIGQEHGQPRHAADAAPAACPGLQGPLSAWRLAVGFPARPAAGRQPPE